MGTPIREAITPMLPLMRIWIATPSRRDWIKFVRSGDARIGYVAITEQAVRELVCEPIRGDVTAMWSDPRERWGRR